MVELTGLDLGEFFHVGIVVPDLAQGMNDVSAQLGVSWSPVLEITGRQWTRRRGVHQRSRQFAFSTIPPHLEILEIVPGSIWDGPMLNHVAFWSRDVERDAARLESLGWEREVASYSSANDAAGEGGLGVVVTTYHRYPDGSLLVELTSESNKAWLHEMLAAR